MAEATPPAMSGPALTELARWLTAPLLAALVVPAILIAGDPWRRQTEAPSLAIGAVVTVSALAMLVRAGRDRIESGAGGGPGPGGPVTSGLFARSRNPVYLAVLAILAGLAMASRSPILGAYLLTAVVTCHLLVVLHDEPRAARDAPDRWDDYRRTVPRWFPRPIGSTSRR